MVLPLLKVGRLTLKTMAMSFSTRIKPKYNRRMANTKQPTTEALTLNKDKAELNLTVSDVLILSAQAAVVIFGVPKYVRFRAEILKKKEELGQEIEERKEALRIQKSRNSEAKRGGGFEARNSGD